MPDPEHPHPDLAPAFAAWQETSDPQAAAQILGRFGRLAVTTAIHYGPGLIEEAGCTLDYDDLSAVGRWAILHRAGQYDPARGNRFTTSAVPAIRGAIYREFHRHVYSAYVPADVASLTQLIRKCNLHALDQGLPPPTDADIEAARIAAKLDPMPYTEEGEIPPYNALYRVWRAISLEEIIEESEETLVAAIEDAPPGHADDPGPDWERAHTIANQDPLYADPTDAIVASLLVRSFIANAFRGRGGTTRHLQQEALALRYGLDSKGERKPAEIAKKLGIWQQLRSKHPDAGEAHIDSLAKANVRRLLQRAIAHLKIYAEEQGIDARDFV